MTDRPSTIRAALDAGLNTEALDLARRAAPDDANSAEIRYLGALACARMGALDDAERWLAPVDRETLGDTALAVEVWGLAGRIAKERYAAAARAGASTAARDLARVAIDCYRQAFAIGGSAYPAVNAATLATLAGDAALARRLARAALSALGASGDHWHHASSGEALLLLDDIEAARAQYAEAHRLAASRFGDIAAMRRQLLLIGSDAARALLDAVPAPQVIAFSGHMIDQPPRIAPRFPAALEPQVAAALRATLARLGPSIGYAQAACGADILFLEAMQDAGMQTHVVLPFARADFIRESVGIAGDSWVARFERALDRATRVLIATAEAYFGDEVLFEHAANLVQGMAFLHARELSTQPLMLTVLEPGSPALVGGTASSARIWSSRGGRIENIDLALLRGDASAARRDAQAAPAATPAAPTATRRSLKSLLFADISGFSKMPEQQTPHFVGLFLETCARILHALEFPAVDANTRGDALFLVFERPSHAAECAARLQQAMRLIDYAAFGLARETNVRIGLHTGPVYCIYDPVMAKTTYYGSHVNLAARLEPIVQTGHIFMTEAFAASLVADGEGRFSCHYIGAMPLAKHFGETRLYRLHS